jgi:phosphate transport system protein
VQDLRKSFHQQLDDIKADMVRLAAMVTEIIPRATEILLNVDLTAAQELIEGDDVLDVLSIDIEERCYQVLALQQPMAGDLRAIVTAIRMTAEIERSGDLCVNIAKGTRRLYGSELSPRLRGLVTQMGEESCRLFKLAMDSYIEGDAAKAAALDDLDDRLDGIHKDYIAEIFESVADREIQTGVQLALIGRYYERIGDHAVNIGERVRYMVTGWLPEHAASLRTNATKLRLAAGEEVLTGPGVAIPAEPDSDIDIDSGVGAGADAAGDAGDDRPEASGANGRGT